jgi:hypothetical protein
MKLLRVSYVDEFSGTQSIDYGIAKVKRDYIDTMLKWWSIL